MKISVYALALSGLMVAACASSPESTETVLTAPVAEQVPDIAEPVEPAALDLTEQTRWFAVEKLWPEFPYMTVLNSASTDSDTFALTFSCNTDDGALIGDLANQPLEMAGLKSTFSLNADDGSTTSLEGDYSPTEDGDVVFRFPVDWSVMETIEQSDRVDFIDAEGNSHLALLSANGDKSMFAKTLIAMKNFSATQSELNAYCNPK